jgi:uncharacterized damage-inducible protein DinB
MTSLQAHFVHQAGNNHWSNRRLYGACKGLSEQEYRAPRKSFFGSIHATLNHIVIVDLVYLGRLTNTELVSVDSEELHTDLNTLADAQSETDWKLIDFCERIAPPDLTSRVSYTRENGQRYTETVARILSHLFAHQIHHRGQVHDMLSATSVPPPQLDEFFLSGDLGLREIELEELGLPKD